MRPLTADRRHAPAAAHQAAAQRRPADPAPSIWSYRAQRLWLTPLFHKAWRVGLPLAVIAGAIGWYVSEPGRVQAIVDTAQQIRHEVEERPEFRVALLDIRGASPDMTEEVRGALALPLPQSSFDLDLTTLREQVMSLPAIASADLRVRSGGVLEVAVTERRPALIWQTRDGIHLIDPEGEFVAGFGARALEAPLPMVAGEGADLVVDEALALFEAAEPLGARVQGLVRVGLRRWDVVLRDGPRILLPEHGARAAFDRVLAMDDVRDILDRDLTQIDLRNPERPTVQLTPEALAILRARRDGVDPIEYLDPIGDQRG